VRGLTNKTAQPRTNRQTAAGNCPGFSGITVRELLKTVSGDYRKSCPDFSETRSSFGDEIFPGDSVRLEAIFEGFFIDRLQAD
jgi:hypothetical protein